MKRLTYLLTGCFCFVFWGCVTEYEAKGIKEEKNILVVEGMITEGESYITLSRSINLTDDNPTSVIYVDNAVVCIESDDGKVVCANNNAGQRYGRYTLPVGKLNFDRKYRLKIEILEDDYSADCTVGTDGLLQCPKELIEYATPYMSPILTPEIDSVFWTKKSLGQMVNIHVATHSPDNEVLYYRWSYKEDWEIHSDVYSGVDFTYPFYCWNKENNKNLLIGSAEKTVFGKVTDIITEMHPSSRKLEVLYRIIVKQNAISKRAYDYYANIKKNTQQTSDIFAPIQSELRGNITCHTDPSKPVIGYVDVSTTTEKIRFIYPTERAYEYSNRPWSCTEVMKDSLLEWYTFIPEYFVPFYYGYDENLNMRLFYIFNQCIDCTKFGTTIKPEDWP